MNLQVSTVTLKSILLFIYLLHEGEARRYHFTTEAANKMGTIADEYNELAEASSRFDGFLT
jgi:hypothetical protein